MKLTLLSSGRANLLALIAVSLLSAPVTARAQGQYNILHAFTSSGGDGGGLYGGLVLDKSGNLYGGTSGGGAYGVGIIFELTPNGDGTWSETILLNFNGIDGSSSVASLILDRAGNLYGTTTNGGAYIGGTVFELSPDLGSWTEAILYNFCTQLNCNDGGAPRAVLLMDPSGNLYGTTYGGGIYYGGVAFELMPGSNGWTETVLHNFDGEHQGHDGDLPSSGGLILDPIGDLYGTTQYGGNYPPVCLTSAGCGIVFELEPGPGGTWREGIPHRFGAFPNDGEYAYGGLVFDRFGNLYGTTLEGGNFRDNGVCLLGCGTVFKLAHGSNGDWKETILYNFATGPGGYGPTAGLVIDKAGNLYGTAAGGGGACACGTVFKLTPGSGGAYTYSVLHTFTGTDGAAPVAPLTIDAKRNLYGTTLSGGPGGYGVVFEITP